MLIWVNGGDRWKKRCRTSEQTAVSLNLQPSHISLEQFINRGNVRMMVLITDDTKPQVKSLMWGKDGDDVASSYRISHTSSVQNRTHQQKS